ncbi:MAG: hypothetical protein GX756_06925 [Clostridiales bacterium]|nr:hypothetical protein [Clostridiales bacterium]
MDLASFAILGQYSKIWKPLIVVIIYTIILLAISLLVFRKKLTSDK